MILYLHSVFFLVPFIQIITITIITMHYLLLFSDTVQQFHPNQVTIWGTVLSLKVRPFLYSSLHHQGSLRVNYINH